MMEQLLGRDTDIIKLSNGINLLVHNFTFIIEFYLPILQFQVREIGQDDLLIYLKVTKDYTKEIEKDLIKKISDYCKDGAKITVRVVDSIPLEKSNKRRLIIGGR